MKYYFLLFSLFFSLFLFSQENSIFWKIEKDSVTSYLLGTNHLFGKKFIEKDKIIMSALKSSQLVFTENINSADSIINNRKPFNYVDSLSVNEKNKLYEIVDTKINPLKLTIRELILTTDKYWSIYSCFSKKERKDKILVDDFIKKISKEERIELLGLEDISESLEYIEKEYLADLEEEKLIQGLKYKLHMFYKGQAHNNCSIHEIYRKKVYNYSFDIYGNPALLDNRNNSWMPKIIFQLENRKHIFIAVGIAHLDYKNGIIQQLIQNGYKVTPIKL